MEREFASVRSARSQVRNLQVSRLGLATESRRGCSGRTSLGEQSIVTSRLPPTRRKSAEVPYCKVKVVPSTCTNNIRQAVSTLMTIRTSTP